MWGSSISMISLLVYQIHSYRENHSKLSNNPKEESMKNRRVIKNSIHFVSCKHSFKSIYTLIVQFPATPLHFRSLLPIQLHANGLEKAAENGHCLTWETQMTSRPFVSTCPSSDRCCHLESAVADESLFCLLLPSLSLYLSPSHPLCFFFPLPVSVNLTFKTEKQSFKYVQTCSVFESFDFTHEFTDLYYACIGITRKHPKKKTYEKKMSQFHEKKAMYLYKLFNSIVQECYFIIYNFRGSREQEKEKRKLRPTELFFISMVKVVWTVPD